MKKPKMITVNSDSTPYEYDLFKLICHMRGTTSSNQIKILINNFNKENQRQVNKYLIRQNLKKLKEELS